MNLSKLRSLLSEDHCKKPDSLDCKVERIAKKYAKKEAEKENDEHEEELHEGKWDYPKGITSRRQDKYSEYPPYQKDKRIARKKWRKKIKAAKHKALKLGKLDEHEEELHESKSVLTAWDKKFRKSKGRISGKQKTLIDQMPLHLKKKVLALSRKHVSLSHKDPSHDPAEISYNREMIKHKSEIGRVKRENAKTRKENEKRKQADLAMARSALGVMKAHDEIKNKSTALVKVTDDKPVMLKRKEVSHPQPKPRAPKRKSLTMRGSDLDFSLKLKLDDIASEMMKTRNPIKRMMLRRKANALKKSYSDAKNVIKEGWKQAATYGAVATGAGALTGALVGGPTWAAIGAGLGAADYAFRKDGFRKDWNSKGWSDSKKKKSRVIRKLKTKLAEGKLKDWAIDFEETHGRKPTNDDLKSNKKEKQKKAAKRLDAFVRVSGIKKNNEK